jgi:hypothetical protein
MPMRDRLRLALERLTPGQWQLFETFASSFLADVYTNLVTVASGLGDKGRDAQLWQPKADPSVLLQYSVASDWTDKVVSTARTLKDNFPDVSALVYVTNHAIPTSDRDALTKRIRTEYQLFLDFVDQGWFLDRIHRDLATECAAEDLARVVVDPLLASEGVIENKAQALTVAEEQAAFVYLNLQRQDDNEKGLTKTAFDALVRAALRNTSTEGAHLARQQIYDRIAGLIPGHELSELKRHIDGSLRRLDRSAVRHWQKDDEFCLTHEERVRLSGRLASLESLDIDLRTELAERVHAASESLHIVPRFDSTDVALRVRRVVEHLLLDKGEAFVRAMRGDSLPPVTNDEIKELAIRELAEHGEITKLRGDGVALLVQVASEVLTDPRPEIRRYLRLLADSYTLFAFLRATPDVQSAVVKLFSQGEVWLDTNVVLRLMAEDLLDNDERQFTLLLRAVRDAGIRLYVTPGVVEELDANTFKALLYARDGYDGPWRGAVPFLYTAFVWSGNPPAAFASWLDRFRGARQPQDDIAAYLSEEFRIEVHGFADDAPEPPDELRRVVEEVWREMHVERRNKEEMDEESYERLVAHDVENFLGVLQRRKRQRDSPVGYTSWWLTLDRRAFKVRARIAERLERRAPDSPVLSPDFLSEYLAVTPLRAQLRRRWMDELPATMVDVAALDAVPQELVALAAEIRESMQDLPPRVVRRHIRDMLNVARARLGEVGEAGWLGVEKELREAFGRRRLGT